MYKTTSRNSQSRVERILMKDMPAGEDGLPDDDRRKLLVDKICSLDATIISLPKKHPERERLGKLKFALQTELSKIKTQGKKRPALGQCFIDAAFRMLPRETYTAILEEAKHVHDIRYRGDEERTKKHMTAAAEGHLDKVERVDHRTASLAT